MSARPKVSITSVLPHYIDLKKRGRCLVTCCPFHQEAHPSFTVYPEKNIFVCYGCKVWGDAIKFVMMYRGHSYHAAIREIRDTCGIDIPIPAEPAYQKHSDSLSRLCQFYHNSHLRIVNAFLQDRSVDPSIGYKYKIGYNPKNHRITFPLRSAHGSYIGIASRSIDNSEPRYINSAESSFFKKSKYLYGLYEIERSPELLLVVEGYMDVVSLRQNGYHAVALCGTNISEHQIQTLLCKSNRIVFCMDGDATGQSANYKIWLALVNFDILRTANIRFALLPKNTDPDSFLRTYGKDNWNNIITSSVCLLSLIEHKVASLSVIERAQQLHYLLKNIVVPKSLFYVKRHLLDNGLISKEELDFLPQTEEKQIDNTPNRRINVLDKPIAFFIQFPAEAYEISKDIAKIESSSPSTIVFNKCVQYITAGVDTTQDILRYLEEYVDRDLLGFYLTLDLILNGDILKNEIAEIIKRITTHDP